jgi:uncharacterized membrane protein
MYNTIMAVSAGVGLIGVALLGRQVEKRQAIAAEGWSLLFAIVGGILSTLGFIMTVSWPFRVPGTVDGNVLMGEPSMAFGLLLLAASFYLWQRRAVFAAIGSASGESDAALDTVYRALKPVSIFVFATGLMMLACAVAWIRYQMGNAPSVEPLTGYLATVVLKNAPVAESFFLGILWGLVALGSLLFPLALRKKGASGISAVIFAAWLVAGCVFLGFGALNYYTHVGLISNTTNGTDFKI